MHQPPRSPDSDSAIPNSEEHEEGSAFSAYRAKESRRSGLVFAERYQVRGFLNRGAHARVYLAEDLTTHAPVALKILSTETARSPDYRLRLAREAQAMQAISHPNVATVIESGETQDGVPFLAMEALLGESLGDFVRRQSVPLPSRCPCVHKCYTIPSRAHRRRVARIARDW